ncbi:membrane protein insertase YidC [Thermithiobacillus tepidarius DSM 3134]|uniref:membrane protein insertase YidC n=1 Tax=Thermithiobacillus tepidarius TaxID=929 RepID=UPI00041EFA2E|nr:membrane protein insertase YidC [Thermithiobacillus tepidarius]
MDPQKTLLAVALSIIVLLLFQSWNAQRQPAPVAQTSAPAASAPASPVPAPAAPQVGLPPAGTAPQLTASGGRIQVETDLYRIEIDKLGGDIRRLALKAYPERVGSEQPVQLLAAKSNRLWLQQSGLLSPGAAAAPVMFSSDAASYRLQPGQNAVEVRLRGRAGDLQVDKVLTFRRGSYLIDQRYELVNQGSQPWQGQVYNQFMRDGSTQGSMFLPVFTGAVLYRDGDFIKEKFEALNEKPAQMQIRNGWAGLMDHYFLSAVLPPQNQPSQIYARATGDGYYVSGAMQPLPLLGPGQQVSVAQQLFIGPKEQDVLGALDRGLNRSVDYGWLTVIGQPLFQLLSWFHKIFGNWGIAIILLTVVVKLLFFPLSGASYKSMANMRKLQPKMTKLRERYKDDRQKLGEAMMELYKTEKINPLAGCLPIVVQIPVFIALYWVLLESVELRQAPFMLWIQDLSAKDPFFVLPILMGISMILQQRLNPAPMDPIQQKVMYLLPVIFTVFFAFFPAGLVLYWLVNNLISIGQQWYITHKVVEQAA